MYNIINFFEVVYNVLKPSAPLPQVKVELDPLQSCGVNYGVTYYTYYDQNAAKTMCFGSSVCKAGGILLSLCRRRCERGQKLVYYKCFS